MRGEGGDRIESGNHLTMVVEGLIQWNRAAILIFLYKRRHGDVGMPNWVILPWNRV
jgi:hypothetical protein